MPEFSASKPPQSWYDEHETFSNTKEPMKTRPDGIPRRIDLNLQTPAERAIGDAVRAVEGAGAHPLLTEASMLLQAAKDKVADFVELDDPDGRSPELGEYQTLLAAAKRVVNGWEESKGEAAGEDIKLLIDAIAAAETVTR